VRLKTPEEWKINSKLDLRKIVGYIQFLKNENISFKNLLLLVELAWALLGISAKVEKVFSFVNALWTIEKNRFDVETVGGSLLIKARFQKFLALTSTVSVNRTPNSFGTFIKQT
jgi:hypothetical protein